MELDLEQMRADFNHYIKNGDHAADLLVSYIGLLMLEMLDAMRKPPQYVEQIAVPSIDEIIQEKKKPGRKATKKT